MKNIIIKSLIGIAFLNQFNLNAQKSDFIVNQSNDTISVDKIKLKYDKVRVKHRTKTTKYTYDEIKSFYISKENNHYVKIKSPLGKNLDVERDEVFLVRMTENGKVNLYEYDTYRMRVGANGTSFVAGSYSTYIGIYDSKPESIYIGGTFSDNKLEYKAYEILKLYLNGNHKILNRLEDLYKSKQKGMTEKVISLINDYNNWVLMKK